MILCVQQVSHTFFAVEQASDIYARVKVEVFHLWIHMRASLFCFNVFPWKLHTNNVLNKTMHHSLPLKVIFLLLRMCMSVCAQMHFCFSLWNALPYLCKRTHKSQSWEWFFCSVSHTHRHTTSIRKTNRNFNIHSNSIVLFWCYGNMNRKSKRKKSQNVVLLSNCCGSTKNGMSKMRNWEKMKSSELEE